MLRRLLVGALALLVIPFVPLTVADGPDAPSSASAADPAGPGPILEDGRVQLIVGHAAGPITFTTPLLALGGKLLATDDTLGFSVVQVPVDHEERFRTRALLSPDVTYVKRDGIIQAHLIPEDPYYPQQWGPPAIGMEQAWDLATGDHNVTVAVLDTGVDHTHEDLAGNVCGTGRDFVNDDLDAMDDHRHGTHVAGTIAAHIGNGTGVAGMAEVCILPVKVLGASGSGSWSGLASALTWTADQGVDIISMSLGGCPGCDPGSPVTEAIQYAATQGVLIVASAGNAHCDAVGYPAAYPEVIAVAALAAPGDDTASFSSCGPEVEVAAPGQGIISTVPLFYEPSGYATFSGTSMAAPHVAGVAALLKSESPTLDADDLRCILAQRADDLLLDGRDNATGYGRIDALDMLLHPTCTGSLPVAPEVSVLAGDLSAHIMWNKPFAWGGVDGYDIYMGIGDAEPTLVAQVGDVRTHRIGDLTEGTTYRFAVAAWNDAGQGETSAAVPFVARTALTVPYALDLTSGLEDWNATGLWHVTTDRSASGPSAYFGIEGGSGLEDNGYATGRREHGDLRSPPIRLPATGPITLTFWQHASLGNGYEEHPTLQVATEADATAATTAWEMSSIVHEGTGAADLSAFAGQVVWLRFHVDTRDGQYNGGEGWYLDDITLDTVAPPLLSPLIDIVYPDPGTIQPADDDVGAFVTDPNGQDDIANVTILMDGSTLTGEYVAPFAYVGRYFGAATGTHLATATVVDQSGRTASDDHTFSVDGGIPVVTVSAPNAGAVFTCSVSVSGSASDDLTGVSLIGVGVGIDPVTGDTVPAWHQPLAYIHFSPARASVDWSVNLRTPTLAAGAHLLMVAVWDDAGNLVRENRTITKSDVLCTPKITITGPEAGTVVGCSAVLTGTVEAPQGKMLDDGFVVVGDMWWHFDLSGAVDDFDIRLGLATRPPGPFTLTVYAYDSSGNTGSTTLTLTRDDTDCLPRAIIASPTSGDGVSCAVEVRGTAYAGPENELTEVQLLVDGHRVDENAAAGQEQPFDLMGDLVGLAPGEHTLQVRVFQSDASNLSAPVTIVRDATDCYPSGAILLPVDGHTIECTATLAGTAAAGSIFGLGMAGFWVGDNYVGHASLTGTTGEHGRAVWQGEARLGAFGPGPLDVALRIRDGRGNEATVDEVTIVRDATDCRPRLTLESPTEDSVVRCGVRVRGIAEDPEGRIIDHVRIRLGEYYDHYESSGSDTHAFDVWFPRWLLYPGTTVRVTALNEVGGIAEEVRHVVLQESVDCEPLVTIQTPTPYENVSGTSEVTGNITIPDVPLEGDVQVLVDGKVVAERPVTGDTFRVPVDWTRLPDGETFVVVRVLLDHAEGTGSAFVTVNVANAVAPSLSDWTADGTVGCSARVGGAWTKDACHRALRLPVAAGLTGGRLVLEWDADDATDPFVGSDHLSVQVMIAGRAWSASAAPGEHILILDLDAPGTITRDDTEALIEVMVGREGGSHAAALQEGFRITGQWAYGGATPTL